ncbi:MAG: hypothetical protein ACI4IW_05255 [Oscillospiraceae bacterium]
MTEPTEHTGLENESTPQISNESVPESSLEKPEENDSENNDDSSITEEIPEGYQEIDFGAFSVLICDDSFSGCAPMETVTMENNQFIGEDGESKRVVAEFLSIEDIVDSDNPFAPYDEKYASAVNTVELSFNDHPAKEYHIQTQIDDAVPVLTNNIFYCIQLNDKIITFAYYPVMGYGGLRTEDIEAILGTIKAK